MIRVFIGYDHRESIAYHVLTQSIINETSAPVAITPLAEGMLGGFDGQRDGTNAFIYSRFLVPELCEYKGWALYFDSDMLVRADLAHLWAQRDPTKAVMVVPHDYHTKHRRKLVGTPMECGNQDYERKNWSSLILWNCEHPANRRLTSEMVAESPGSLLHRFRWLKDDEIGYIALWWNWLVGEYGHLPNAKLVHFTAGAPCFAHYSKCDYATEWKDTRDDVTHALDNYTIMGAA